MVKEVKQGDVVFKQTSINNANDFIYGQMTEEEITLVTSNIQSRTLKFMLRKAMHLYDPYRADNVESIKDTHSDLNGLINGPTKLKLRIGEIGTITTEPNSWINCNRVLLVGLGYSNGIVYERYLNGKSTDIRLVFRTHETLSLPECDCVIEEKMLLGIFSSVIANLRSI